MKNTKRITIRFSEKTRTKNEQNNDYEGGNAVLSNARSQRIFLVAHPHFLRN